MRTLARRGEEPPAVCQNDGMALRDAKPRTVSTRSLIAVGCRVTGVVMGVLVAASLARQLGPNGFGELALALGVAAISQNIVDFGATQVAVGEIAARPELRGELTAGLIVGRLIAGVAAAIIGSIVVVALAGAGAAVMGIAVVATVPLAAISGATALANTRLRPEIAAAFVLLQSVLWLACIIILGLSNAPLAGYGAAFLLCAVAQTAAVWLLVPDCRQVEGQEWWAGARLLLSKCWPLGLAGLCVTAYYRLDGVLVYHFRGAHESGLYAGAYRFLDALQIVPGVLLSLLIPAFARLRAGAEFGRFRKVFDLGLRLTLVTALPLAFGLLATSVPVIEALYGPRFTAAAPMLAVLGLAFVGVATGYVYSAAAIALGQTRLLGVVAAAGAIVCVAADLIAIPRWGGLGAAWVTVITEFLTTALLAQRLSSRHGLHFGWSGLIRSGVAAGLMTGAVLTSVHHGLLAQVGVGVGVYALAIFALRGVTREDVYALVADRRVVLA